MQKLKKGIAVALTATMVVGSGLTAFASDTTPTTPGGTGTSTGTGSSEGHLDKEKLNVVLPTIASGSTPFNYTMDPERLIQETNGVKYEDFTFPAVDSDTGVYFQTGEKEYKNTSNTYKVINKSSCNVTIDVDVQATASAGGKDIALATAAPADSAATAELYLGLTAGNETKAVSMTKATISKTIAGNENNFETVYKNNAYAYEEKATLAGPWKAMDISMTGAVNKKAIAADTTAPQVAVTWTWKKAADGATVDTGAQVDYTDNVAPSIAPLSHTMTAGTDLDIPVNLGVGTLGATGIASVVCGGETFSAGTHYTYDADTATLTFPTAMIDYWIGSGVTSTEVVVTFNDSASTSVTLTIATASN